MIRINHYAGVYLTSIQAGRDPNMVNELVYTVANQNQLVPPEHIPYLLDIATDDVLLRPYVVKVSGDAVTEFARTHNKWRWVLPIAKDVDEYIKEANQNKSETDAIMVGAYFSAIKNYVNPDDEMIIEHPRHNQKYDEYTLKFPMSMPLTKVYMKAIVQGSAKFDASFVRLCSLSVPNDVYVNWQRDIGTKDYLWSSINTVQTKHTVNQLLNVITVRRQMINDLETIP